MKVETILDTRLSYSFCASLEAAEQASVREAADTGGIVLRIKSLRLEPNRLVVAGVVPRSALVIEYPSELPANLRPRSIGTMRLIRDSLLHRGSADEIGYLVLQTPVAAAEQLPESEDGENSWVALSIRRALHTLEPVLIGEACCARCNRPIPPQRLMAVPRTRVCMNCQQIKENA
jgi:DksA/TraR C4-type zinc finger protein